jgi:hypothetical protein
MAITEIETLADLPLNDDESIFVALNDINGRLAVDIRKWYVSDDDWRPTQKGISLPIKLVAELVAALSNLADNEHVKARAATPEGARKRPVKKVARKTAVARKRAPKA